MSGPTPAPSLSIVLPFADHEDVVGGVCRRLASHCRSLAIDFEILAVDEGSGDNSHALLALMRTEVPELRVVTGPAPHRGFTLGADLARGRALLLVEPDAAARSLAPLANALERVAAGLDLILLPGRFAVAKRTRILSVLDPGRARGLGFEHRLARRAMRRGLAVEVWSQGGRTAPRDALSVRRLFDVLLLAVSR
jgi:hypothetical protein